MLKIKDNVDLKELEKFGFEKDEYGDYAKKLDIKRQFENEVTMLFIMVDGSEHLGRIGYVVNGMYCVDIELDIIFDLIKADMVEKSDKE